MLYSLQDRWLEMQTRRELDSIQTLLQHQYEMYRQSRENIEIVNRKFHDLKHQIGVIRMEPDQKKREEYLKQVESGLKNAEADINTGNSVLDTILTGKQMYCKQNNIDMTVVADGTLLHFMEVMDICSIFGNALDNAIESVEKLSEPQKRLIRVAVYNQNNFLMIRVENYFESPLDMTNGEIQTTKKDKDYHGYGVKSIRYTAEQYGGSVSITAEDNWFYLRILIPISDNQK
jgi:sensor histidine kinase regulating citrate/malate metabolism